MADMGTIMARLGLDDSRFKAGVNNAGKWGKAKFAAIGSAMAGAFAATFTVEKFKEAMNFAAGIQELSEQTGLTTEEFQRLSYQLRQVGGNQQDVVRGLNTLDRMMGKVRDGNEQAIKDFERLGISMDDVISNDRISLLTKLSDAMLNVSAEERGGALDALRRLLGDDSARRFIAAFEEDFVGGMAQANVISDETITNMKKLTGQIQILNDTVLKKMAEFLSGNSDEIVEFLVVTTKAANAIGDMLNKLSMLNKVFGESSAFAFQKLFFERLLMRGPFDPNLNLPSSITGSIKSKGEGQSTENYLREMRDSLKAIQQKNGIESGIMG